MVIAENLEKSVSDSQMVYNTFIQIQQIQY